jgi:hypothetical protein
VRVDRTLDLVHKLHPTNLPILQILQPTWNALQASVTHLRRMRLDRAIIHQPLAQRPELRCKLVIILIRRKLRAKLLSEPRVSERHANAHILPRELLHRQDARVLPALGADGGRRDIRRRAFGDGVEDQFQTVVGGLADLGADVGLLVVEDLVGTEFLEQVEVVWGGGGSDFEAGELGELDGEGAGGGRAAVDQDPDWR